MKQPKKLTKKLKIMMSKLGYDPNDWCYKKSANGKYLILVHKRTGERKVFSA